MRTTHGLRRVDATTSTTSPPHSAVAVGLVILTLIDLAIACSTSRLDPVAISAVVAIDVAGLYALMAPWNHPRPSREIGYVITAVLSVAATLTALATGNVIPAGPGEVVVYLLLILSATRAHHPLIATTCAIAFITLPFRFYDPSDSISLYIAPGFVLLILALLAGVQGRYLRSLDSRHTVGAENARRAERHAMAADLHDFVAHHVTGIAVQAQVARMLGTTDPSRLAATLETIETAAVEALESMRQSVGILRQTTSVDEPLLPSRDLLALPDLIAQFSQTCSAAIHFTHDDEVSDRVPHALQAAAYRIVQESLTNVRKHATGATDVSIAISTAGDNLRVVVEDNGRTGPHTDSGYGLIGLTERVAALGGTFCASPSDDETGWRVVATMPWPPQPARH